MKSLVVVVLTVMCFVGSVSAFDGWVGGGGTNLWVDGGNWSRGFMPRHDGESTAIQAAGSILVDGTLPSDGSYSSGPFLAKNYRGEAAGDIAMTFAADAFELRFRDEFWMRAGASLGDALLDMQGGGMYVGLSGADVLNTGAIFRVGGGDESSVSHVQLDGGFITVANLDVRDGQGTIDITNGILGVVGNYEANAGITGYGGAGIVNYDFDAAALGGLGLTTITAIPEPATMLLLGLGGLVLRRKKH